MSRRWYLPILLASSLGLLAALELGLRLLTGADSRWNVRLGAGKQFDPVTQFRNRPHFPAGDLRTNERGYLAPDGLAPPLPPDRLRLLYLGDSVTFLPPRHNYPRQIERLLAGRGVPVETVNTAVPGFASENVRALFETEVSELEADYLFVYVGWNDLGQYGPEGLPYKKRRAGYQLSPLQRVLSNVYSIRFVYALQRTLRQWLPTRNDPLSERESALYEGYRPTHFEENLRAVLELARRRYPRVVLLNLATITSAEPSEDEMRRAHFPIGMSKNLRKLDRLVASYNAVVAELAAEQGVTLVDLHAAFASHEAKRDFTDSAHVTPAGAERIARSVIAAIEPTLPGAMARLPR